MLPELHPDSVRLCAEWQARFEAEGYGPELARRAVARAKGHARQYTQAITTPEVRQQAYLEILADRLAHARPYMDGLREFVAATA